MKLSPFFWFYTEPFSLALNCSAAGTGARGALPDPPELCVCTVTEIATEMGFPGCLKADPAQSSSLPLLLGVLRDMAQPFPHP